MARREDDLIAQIEQDALDDTVPVATALRKCIVLGGRSGSEPLRDWATRELKGYGGEDELPDYRIIRAPLMVDGVAGNVQVTQQQIPASSIPEFARDRINEQLELRDGVGNLEALVKRDEIKLQPPMASDLVRLMNHESENPYQHIVSLYWGVSPAALHGVLDQIRTALTQLVGELRANVPEHDAVPSADAVNQAVNVVVTGKRSRVNVTAAQASGPEATATSTVETAPPPEESGFWTRWRKIGAFIVGAASVAGVVISIVHP
jgi:AbiTii